MARLIPIYCVTCGRPTGNVIDKDKFNDLSNEQQTCTDCAGYHPNPTVMGETGFYACTHCGGENFMFKEICEQYPYGTIRREADGRLIARVDDWGSTEPDHVEFTGYVACSECDRQVRVDRIR